MTDQTKTTTTQPKKDDKKTDTAGTEKNKTSEKKKQQPLTRQAAARPLTTVYSILGKPTKTHIKIPDVLLTPIRDDIIRFVHTNMAKNGRQPYAVKVGWGPRGVVAGHQVSAASWGTGRAVARVPRVKGGGTHRAGQGAFANMCRGGRMFAPTKVFRRWNRKINTNQKRYAVCAALAASSVPALVMARGHRVQKTDEIPLVVEDDLQHLRKTKHVVNALASLKLSDELKRCKRRYKRAGQGKARNRRFRHRVGPLIVYKDNNGIAEGARNIRGVDVCKVSQLNLLKLAPGGHVGRLIVWTESALRMLPGLYGTLTKKSLLKKNYHIPRPLMTNSDLNRIINSQEIQSVIRPKKRIFRPDKKRNPLKHPHLYARLNPLFAEEYQKVSKTYRRGSRPRTTKLLKPLKQKFRVRSVMKDDEKQKLRQQYWKVVHGDAKTFKTRRLLLAEKEEVRRQLAAIEKEKKGLRDEELKENDDT